MSKKPPRPIRMESDPQEEKIVETYIEQVGAPSARERNLFWESRAEILSGIPVAPPVGYQKQPSMVDHIRGLVRSEHLRYAATNAGYETFEESEDFELDDDLSDPHTPYEAHFDPAPDPTSPSDAPSLKAGTPPEGVGSQPATPPAPEPKSSPEGSKPA